MIKIQTWGSFRKDEFQTCAEEGGHVAAIRRAITFLNGMLVEAVRKDAMLVAGGEHPPAAPLGEDVKRKVGTA